MVRDELVCCAMPFGYGPAAKLLALAEALRRHWRLVFVGRGAALELVSRRPAAFDAIVAANPVDASAASPMARAWGVLSVMDRAAGVAAERRGKPLFAVDSLLWMRDRVPPELSGARIYFAQRFCAGPARADGPRAVPVGPIVSIPSARPSVREGLVVHLGGSAAPDARGALYDSYARFVLRAVRAAGLADRFGRIDVLGGAAVIGALAADAAGDPRIRLHSAALHEARARMAGARAVLSAPGLTTALECFGDGTPLWFLPPQNYSQWCILRELRARGAADGALHWEDLPGFPRLGDRLPAEQRDPIVVQAIAAGARAASAGAELERRLSTVGTEPERRAATQSAFFASLGPPGTDRIASALLRLRTADLRPGAAVAPA